MATEKAIDDGGPAFPCPVGGSSFMDQSGYTTWQFPGAQGLSLRDWFAGQAIAVIVEVVSPSINPAIDGACEHDGISSEEIDAEARTVIAFEILSRRCYQFADAMLAARKAVE